MTMSTGRWSEELWANAYREELRRKYASAQEPPPAPPKQLTFPPNPSLHKSPEMVAKCPYCNPKEAL